MKIKRKDLDALIHEIIGKKKSRLSWCIYENESPEAVDDENWLENYENEILELEFDSFDDVFEEGNVLFKHCGYWSGAKFVRKKNPTWRDVVKVAEKFASGDHIFLESIDFEGEEDGVKVFDLGYGS